MMKIKAASVEQDDQTHPVVHFRGTSRAIDHSWDDNANSDIRGKFLFACTLMDEYCIIYGCSTACVAL